MENELRQLNERLTRIEKQLGGLTNDPRQVEVIRKVLKTSLELEKLGIETTPVTTQAKIDDPTGGLTVDTEARAAIVAMIDVLETFGFSALS